MLLSPKNTAWEFIMHPPQIAILPLACQEPHSPRLPLGADQLILSELALRAAAGLGKAAFLLPTWPFGMPRQNTRQAGAISLGYETLWWVVRDMVTSLVEHHIHQVVVINDLGSPAGSTALPEGNTIVKTAVRQLNVETPGLTAIWLQPFAVGREALHAIFPQGSLDPQEGVLESSILMHLRPDLLPETGQGAPQLATAEGGKQAFNAIVSATIEYIEKSFSQLARLKA